MANKAGKMKTTEQSREDYLEAIYRVSKEKGNCRSIDVAELLDVSRPSVSVALHKLAEEGYISFDERKEVKLTDKGRRIARDVFHRHQFFKELLMNAGVKDERAEFEACEIEHCVSNDSFKKLKEYYSK